MHYSQYNIYIFYMQCGLIMLPTVLYSVKNSIFTLLAETYILFQNGRHFSVLLFACKSALVVSFKGKYSFDFKLKNETTRADLKENKRTL